MSFFHPPFQFTPLREGRLRGRPAAMRQAYFNSRPCERGDLCSRRAWLRTSNFNSRPCERGDLSGGMGRLSHEFQFTPLREGRPNSSEQSESQQISIHAPARGATGTGKQPGQRNGFQFTPLREGRLVPARLCWDHWQISIHAPARGATLNRFYGWQSGQISIHAPARGATSPKALVDDLLKFQFTPLREGRQQPKGTSGRPTEISIHAPARGATVPARLCWDHWQISIHAPARGATKKPLRTKIH